MSTLRIVLTVLALAVAIAGAFEWKSLYDNARIRAEDYRAAALFRSSLTPTISDSLATVVSSARRDSTARLASQADSAMSRLVVDSETTTRRWGKWTIGICLSALVAIVLMWFHRLGMIQYHNYRAALEERITGSKKAIDDAAKAAAAKTTQADATAFVTAAGHITVAVRDLERLADTKDLTPTIQTRINDALTALRALLTKIEDLIPKKGDVVSP